MGKPSQIPPIDWEVVRAFFVYECVAVARNAVWARVLAWFAGVGAALAILPGVYRLSSGRWLDPDNHFWLVLWTVGVGSALFVVSLSWSIQRLGRLLESASLDELILTPSAPAEMLLGASIALLVPCLSLLCALLPALLLATAAGGATPIVTVHIFSTVFLWALLGHALGVSARTCLNAAGSHLLKAALLAFVVLLLGLVGQLCGGWLAVPFRWLVHHNPVTALISATSPADPSWAWSFGVTLALVVISQSDAFRLMQRDWSVVQLDTMLRKRGKKRRMTAPFERAESLDMLAPLCRHPLLPVIWREHRRRYRKAVRDGFIGCFAVLLNQFCQLPLFLGLKQLGHNVVGRRAVAVFVCACLLHCTQDVVTQFSRTVQQPRWQEWLLTRIPDWELADWLVWSWAPWWAVSWVLAAVGSVYVFLVRPVPTAIHLLWSVLTALALVPTASLLAALITLRSPSTGDARWRVFLLLFVLPVIAAVGVPFGVDMDWLGALSPVFGIVKWTFRGDATPAMWMGTLLYGALFPFMWGLISRKLRVWTLPS